jgi:hypothetical protein
VGPDPSLQRLRHAVVEPIAGDDNPLLLVRIAVKPLAQPPFPLDRLALI